MKHKRLHIIPLILCMLCAAPSLRADEPREAELDVTDPFDIATAGADSLIFVSAADTLQQPAEAADSMPARKPMDYDAWEEREVQFNPDPTRAVWMSALFPGLGQLYNRRYWKLPIVAGAYVGLGYATSWNNSMLRDYTRAYRDITDNDDSTRSYMDFFPPTTKEEDLDRTWLTNIMRARKDFYRRNRDLCIISMVGVYLLAMVDAYVDASLSHFDITPDLAMDIAPQLMLNDSRISKPALGLVWALTF